MSDSDRIDALERTVRELTAQVERLSAELGRVRDDAGTVRSGDQPPHRSAAAPAPAITRAAMADSRTASPGTRAATADRRSPQGWRALSLETLIGRYAALALAGLAILLGVGVFLSWAVENVRIGASARVLLGTAAAALVAGLGAWLRTRGARRFGNVLFGLALAIVHVVAWGAGPYLEVVSPSVAFGGAALASLALAMLAWRENEESLFAVGLGGALLAPFVTSHGESRVLPLLTFGLLVIGTGIVAIGDRAWRVAAWLLVAGTGLYVGASLTMADFDDPVARIAPAVFGIILAWVVVIAAGPSHRLRLGRGVLVLALVAVLSPALTLDRVTIPELIAASLAVGATAYALLQRVPLAPEASAFRIAVMLPLGALATALVALVDPSSPAGALVAAGWAVAASAAAWMDRDVKRDAHLLVATLAAGVAVVAALHDDAAICVLALVALAAFVTLGRRALPAAGLAAGALIVLMLASAWVLASLADRPAWGYTPFAGKLSAAALATALAWWLWSATVIRIDDPPGGSGVRTAVRLVAPALAFAWGYLELAGAISREMSTFLVILYFAATGVGAILLGRTRALPPARHAGLALAILAGLKALAQASALGFGLRLSSYLVVGAFLLGVAYLYRATAEGGRESSVAAP